MRILVLLDDITDPKISQPPEHLDPLAPPNAQRDLTLVLPRLDPGRVQLVYCALRGPASGDRLSLNARRQIDIAAWRRLARLIREQDIELVHAFGPAAIMAAAAASRMTGCAAIASIYQLTTPPNPKPLDQIRLWPLIQLMRTGISHLIVPCEHLQAELWRDHYPIKHSVIIYPGVEVRETPHATRAELGLPEGPLLVTSCELAAGEGGEALLDVIHRVLQRIPMIEVVMLGSGPLIQKMRQRAVQIRPALPILWSGNRTDALDVMASSDVAISHTRSEAVGPALEAVAAAGKPVVAARVGIVPEFVEDKETGLLVTFNDTRDMAMQIDRLILQPHYAREMGKAAQKRARERYSNEAQIEAITSLYESAVYETR